MTEKLVTILVPNYKTLLITLICLCLLCKNIEIYQKKIQYKLRSINARKDLNNTL